MEQQRLSFYSEIRNNKIYSVILITFIFVLLIALGYAISFAFDPSYFYFILIISIIFSLVYIIGGYYFSAEISIASVKAIPANPSQHKMFFDLVEGLTLASGLPMPKLYIMRHDQINAFASGRGPQHAVICVTTGCLEKLNKHELEGVLSHELSHIANYDIRFMTLTAVLVGMIAIISEIFLRSLWFRGGNNDDNKGNAILMVVGIVLAILAPIVVQLVQFAISRKREYAADASAVMFIRSPTGLTSALRKIKNEHVPIEDTKKVPKAVAPLFISDPFKKRLENLTSTHPPIEKRIEILERM